MNKMFIFQQIFYFIMVRVAINGFGRIGRCILRALYEEKIEGIEVVAINGPAEIHQHTHLFEFDSVHGRFAGEVSYYDRGLIINNKKIPVFREKEISKLPWKDLQVDVVMECTGLFTSKDKASLHLEQGAKKVIISAPAKESDVKTVVMGVNHNTLKADDSVFSVGSCTTNCLAPIAKVLDENFGIITGFMTTIHSYTGDQNILDASHKGDLRRARAGAISMVPTSTGAAKAIGLVLPQLAGKLDGSAIRVPTPNVSVVDLCFVSNKSTSVIDVNEALYKASKQELKGILGFEEKPLVSTDFNGNPHSSIVDAKETKVTGANLVRVLSWYDNEWGFSVRMLEASKFCINL
jgi:glyceraldehyde 3-phosphate dehydrogenase